VVFADPENETARLFQADALEQLGYQSESGPWRDFYLSGALELRSNGTMFKNAKSNALRPGFIHAMTTGQIFDLIGVRLNAPRAEAHSLRFHLTITDRNEQWTFGIRNGVLQTHIGHRDNADASISTTFETFAQFASKTETLSELGEQFGSGIAGDSSKLELFVSLLDYFTFGFEIVLP
jgi:alkyl sulfatase BDS1-like metallo-beta-lactamase superfamily hydrolase